MAWRGMEHAHGIGSNRIIRSVQSLRRKTSEISPKSALRSDARSCGVVAVVIEERVSNIQYFAPLVPFYRVVMLLVCWC